MVFIIEYFCSFSPKVFLDLTLRLCMRVCPSLLLCVWKTSLKIAKNMTFSGTDDQERPRTLLTMQMTTSPATSMTPTTMKKIPLMTKTNTTPMTTLTTIANNNDNDDNGNDNLNNADDDDFNLSNANNNGVDNYAHRMKRTLCRL